MSFTWAGFFPCHGLPTTQPTRAQAFWDQLPSPPPNTPTGVRPPAWPHPTVPCGQRALGGHPKSGVGFCRPHLELLTWKQHMLPTPGVRLALSFELSPWSISDTAIYNHFCLCPEEGQPQLAPGWPPALLARSLLRSTFRQTLCGGSHLARGCPPASLHQLISLSIQGPCPPGHCSEKQALRWEIEV